MGLQLLRTLLVAGRPAALLLIVGRGAVAAHVCDLSERCYRKAASRTCTTWTLSAYQQCPSSAGCSLSSHQQQELSKQCRLRSVRSSATQGGLSCAGCACSGCAGGCLKLKMSPCLGARLCQLLSAVRLQVRTVPKDLGQLSQELAGRHAAVGRQQLSRLDTCYCALAAAAQKVCLAPTSVASTRLQLCAVNSCTAGGDHVVM